MDHVLLEFHCEIKNRKGFENPIAEYLSRIVIDGACETPIFEYFPNEQLFEA